MQKTLVIYIIKQVAGCILWSANPEIITSFLCLAAATGRHLVPCSPERAGQLQRAEIMVSEAVDLYRIYALLAMLEARRQQLQVEPGSPEQAADSTGLSVYQLLRQVVVRKRLGFRTKARQCNLGFQGGVVAVVETLRSTGSLTADEFKDLCLLAAPFPKPRRPRCENPGGVRMAVQPTENLNRARNPFVTMLMVPLT
jgi:hypothetical protein